jgi:predicted transcriptional regulator
VTAAREAGMSKYRIAEVLGVKAPTIDSILKAAKADEDK